ncbi:MAG: hypothetical protein C5B49_15340 [Bdellovibrio sp.]|nr:MAG: hypothetical protein C5B49_15340 [Bdellovibrio sp.]
MAKKRPSEYFFTTKKNMLYNKQYWFYRIVTGLILLAAACVSKQKVGGLVTPNDQPNLRYKYEFDFDTRENVQKQIQKLGSLNNAQSQDAFIRMLIAFRNLKRNLKEDELLLPSEAKTKVRLASFCLASSKAAPEENEIFKWTKGSPSIPLVKQVLKFYAQTGNKDQVSFQELLWNLGNKTYYEDYPRNLRTIIDKIAPSAKFTLPSRIKDKIGDEVIPDEIKDALELAQGKYHSLMEFKSLIEQKKSKISLPKDHLVSKIPDTDLFASSESHGYDTQAISFYNPSHNSIPVNLNDFYLQPVRPDVQPIIMASVIPYLDEIQKILEKTSLKMLGYLGSQYPTLNSSEKQLVKENPIDAAIGFYDAMTAERNGDHFFPNSGQNGESDAFRHFVWAGLMTRDLGETTAKKFLDAHELAPNQPPEEKAMDEFNNDRGVRAGLEMKHFSNQELFDRATKEIDEGKLRILQPGKTHQ